jgi:hypothetical protein
LREVPRSKKGGHYWCRQIPLRHQFLLPCDAQPFPPKDLCITCPQPSRTRKEKVRGPKIIRLPNPIVGFAGDGQRVAHRSPAGLSQPNRNILFDQRNDRPYRRRELSGHRLPRPVGRRHSLRHNRMDGRKRQPADVPGLRRIGLLRRSPQGKHQPHRFNHGGPSVAATTFLSLAWASGTRSWT